MFVTNLHDNLRSGVNTVNSEIFGCGFQLLQFNSLINYFLILVPVYGNLPSERQLADWEFAVSQHSAVPQGILVRLCTFLRINV